MKLDAFDHKCQVIVIPIKKYNELNIPSKYIKE